MQPVLLLPPDVRRQFAGFDCVKKCQDLRFIATGLKFNPAVGEISNPASHIKTLGDVTNGPTKADALDTSFVENLQRCHGREEVIFDLQKNKTQSGVAPHARHEVASGAGPDCFRG